MKLERISHPNYINFIRIKFRQNIPKLTWQLHRGRRKSKPDPDVACYGEFIWMSHAHYVSKGRGRTTGRSPRSSLLCWALGKHGAWEELKLWVKSGEVQNAGSRGRGFAMQWEGSEKGREGWDHRRALMRRGCRNGEGRQKGTDGDSVLIGLPWGCVMMRKESAGYLVGMLC